MESLGKQITKCRMCESENLYPFLDLGFMPPADGIVTQEEIEHPEIHFPLKVCQCQNCGLTQLTYAVNPEILYGKNYSYESSITETGKKHYFEMANSICKKFNFPLNSLAVDIGSNVGVLLEGFRNNGMNILGIDPAPKIAKIANNRGIETWPEFINVELAQKIVREKGKAKIVTGTNVFAHIDDKKGLIESLRLMLDDDGIFVIEAPYFVNLIDSLEYDTIYLDHLEYTSIKPLIIFFHKYGFDVFDVERYDIHGKSVRIFVGKKGFREISKNVKELVQLEEEKGIYRKEVLDEFSNKVKEHKKDFLKLLRELKKQGKKIVGISAPAKGNTLLNYCKIHDDLIDYMTEKSKIKTGHYTPGMHLRIVEEEKILEDKPDYGVIFAWNFAKEIMNNNKEFIKNGGKFIIPIPSPKIIGEDLFGARVEKIEPVHSDERGIIMDLLNKKINHVGLISTETEAVRANHYHNLSTQYSYILSGKFEVLLALSDNPKDVKRVILNAGEIIEIPPKIIHRFKAIEKAIMIDLVSESREGTGYEEDVVRMKIEYNGGD